MAEIRVESKKRSSLAWLWIVLALLVIAAIVWFLFLQPAESASVGSSVSSTVTQMARLETARALAGALAQG